MRETITINLGSAGVNIAQSIWTQLASEHGIGPTNSQDEESKGSSKDGNSI